MKTLVNVILLAVFLMVAVMLAHKPHSVYTIEVYRNYTTITDGGRVIARLTEDKNGCTTVLNTNEGHNCLSIQDAGAWSSFQDYILTLDS